MTAHTESNSEQTLEPCPLKHHVSAGLKAYKTGHDPHIICLDCGLSLAAPDWITVYERWQSRTRVSAIGELLEPVIEWPLETHCLHMKTPLKDVSFLCNAGDFEQLLILSNVVVNLANLTWLRAATAGAKVRLLPPFANTSTTLCPGCGGSGKAPIGCAIDSPLTAPCNMCGGTGHPLRHTDKDRADKGTPQKEVFDRLVAECEQMPRRHCSVHNREEFKYESLEHELHAAAPSAATGAAEGGNPKMVYSKDVMDTLCTTFDKFKGQTVPVSEIAFAVYRDLVAVREFEHSAAHVNHSALKSELDVIRGRLTEFHAEYERPIVVKDLKRLLEICDLLVAGLEAAGTPPQAP